MKYNQKEIEHIIDELVETVGMLSDSMNTQLHDHAKMLEGMKSVSESSTKTMNANIELACEIAQLKMQFKVIDYKLSEVCQRLNISYSSFEKYEEDSDSM